MEFVNGAGGVAGDGGGQILAPGGRFEGALVEVDGDRAVRVHRERRAVGVGDPVDLDSAGRGDVDLDLPQVLRAGADPPRAHHPASVVEPAGLHSRRRTVDQGRRPRRVPGLPDQECDGQGRGRPQGEGRSAPAGARVRPGRRARVREMHAQGRRAVPGRGGPPPQPVDQRPGLHAGESGQPTAGGRSGALEDGELTGQEPLDVLKTQTGLAEVVGRGQRQVALQLGVGGDEVGIEAAEQGQGDLRVVSAVTQQPLLDASPTVGGGHQGEGDGRGAQGTPDVGAHAHRAGHAVGEQIGRPGQGRLVDPVGAGLADPRHIPPHWGVVVAARTDRPGRGRGASCAGRVVGAGTRDDSHGAPPS